MDLQESNRMTPTEAIRALGIKVEAIFVPQSQSRNRDEKPCLNWLVTVTSNNGSITTDYTQGVGHLPRYSHRDKSMVFVAAVKHACEAGEWAPPGKSRPSRLVPPLAEDVLYCLVSDSDALDYSTFEEWAEGLGYDPDSRAAEKVYRECLEIALRMRALLGENGLTTLREAFRDY